MSARALLFFALLVLGCGSPDITPPHDAGSDGPFARPCFPGEGTVCPNNSIAYCYPEADGPAPFPNCGASCGDGSGVGATWCCPDDSDSPALAPSCLDGGAP